MSYKKRLEDDLTYIREELELYKYFESKDTIGCLHFSIQDSPNTHIMIRSVGIQLWDQVIYPEIQKLAPYHLVTCPSVQEDTVYRLIYILRKPIP